MENIDKIQHIIDRPGMYFPDDCLDCAIYFLAGMDHVDNKGNFKGFEDWIIEKYRLEKSAVLWTGLIGQLGPCKTENPESNVHALLSIVSEFIDFKRGEL